MLENLQELKDIYTVLTSGKEGRYFELEKFTEERMIKFMSPKEKTLWIARHREVTPAEKMEAADDITNWASSMKQTDEELRLASEQQAEEAEGKKVGGYVKVDQSDVDSDDNGDIFTEKKLRLSCQNLHETKVTCHLLETRSGETRVVPVQALRRWLTLKIATTTTRMMRLVLTRAPRTKNIATVMITLKNGINSTLRVNSVNWTRLIKRRRGK